MEQRVKLFLSILLVVVVFMAVSVQVSEQPQLAAADPSGPALTCISHRDCANYCTTLVNGNQGHVISVCDNGNCVSRSVKDCGADSCAGDFLVKKLCKDRNGCWTDTENCKDLGPDWICSDEGSDADCVLQI